MLTFLVIIEVLTVSIFLYIAKEAQWSLTIKDLISIILLSPLFFIILVFAMCKLLFDKICNFKIFRGKE